jgi:hypothetical protein
MNKNINSCKAHRLYPGSAHRELAAQQGVAHHQQQEQQQEMELEL